MNKYQSAITIEGGHLACLIFLPGLFADNNIGDTVHLNQGSRLNQPEKLNLAGKNLGNTPLKAVIIACHGYRGGKENGGRIQSLAEKLTANDFGLLAFDFRGSGESSGAFADITVSSQAADLQQIITWVQVNYPVPIVLLGRSLGGSTVLAALADDLWPDAVILWSTPVSVRETFSAMLGSLADDLAAGNTITIKDDFSTYQLGPGFWEDLKNHDFVSCLQVAGKKPMLVIHGEADELVNISNALAIKEIVPSAQLITVPGADHRFINGWELRENLTIAWLKTLFS